MSAAAAVLNRSLNVAAGNVTALPTRQLSGVVLGEAKRALTRAMQDVQLAGMHSRGCPKARETIVPAYLALKTALDVFEAAYKRGVL